jgi:hypothetical protein
MPGADIAGNGSMWVGLETTYGTPVDPSAAGVGVWVPIISESLQYTEAKYYSPQIRQSAIVSDVKQSYYHVEGDIVMEVDPNYMPYFMYASRHTVVKAGAGPYTYVATPTNVGATYPGGSARGLSIVPIRNSIGFMYSGCVVNQWAFTIENGVLRVTMSILGLAETDIAGAVTQSWLDPMLYGAAAHVISVDAAGLTPAFATADSTFNGFTWTANYNGSAQNRIVQNRSATYISYGETELTYETELDFVSKAEYNAMKANTLRAIKLESAERGGVTYTAATDGFRLTTYRSNYDVYQVGLSGIGDLIMARVTGRGIGIAGGVPFKMECKSPANVV